MKFTLDSTSGLYNDSEVRVIDISSIEELVSFIGSLEKQRVVILTDEDIPHIEIYDTYRE